MEVSMAKVFIFVEEQGVEGLRELELAPTLTADEFRQALIAAGATIDAETGVFVDESEEIGAHAEPVELKAGSRIHVSRCKRIIVTAHFQDKTAEKKFPPGTLVGRVKAWAVHEFKLQPKDAAEHVLQICKSTVRPASDTPLQRLTDHHSCAVCFDLVPEKRVEG